MREYATSTLWNCALQDTNREIIYKANLLPKIIDLLDSGNEQIIKSVLATLRNMAYLSACKTAIPEAGGIPKVVNVLKYSMA